MSARRTKSLRGGPDDGGPPRRAGGQEARGRRSTIGWTPEKEESLIKMRKRGHTWKEIASALGVSRWQSVQMHYLRNLCPNRLTEAEKAMLAEVNDAVTKDWDSRWQRIEKQTGRSARQIKWLLVRSRSQLRSVYLNNEETPSSPTEEESFIDDRLENLAAPPATPQKSQMGYMVMPAHYRMVPAIAPWTPKYDPALLTAWDPMYASMLGPPAAPLPATPATPATPAIPAIPATPATPGAAPAPKISPAAENGMLEGIDIYLAGGRPGRQ